MNTRILTTGVVLSRGKMLMLKRKLDDDTYPGVWDCVGGHFEKGESAEQCMLREAWEESGQRMSIVKGGPLIEYLDRYGRAVAIPFILRPQLNGPVVLSEHSEFKWISPIEVRDYDIVPDLAKAMEVFGLNDRRSPRTKKLSRR